MLPSPSLAATAARSFLQPRTFGHLVQPLTSSRDIRAVLAARLSAHAPAVVVRARWLQDRRAAGLPGRVTVVAGKRVGNAVARNRAKRRLRAALREVGVPDGLDLVAIARLATSVVPYPELVAQLAAAVAEVSSGGPSRRPVGASTARTRSGR